MSSYISRAVVAGLAVAALGLVVPVSAMHDQAGMKWGDAPPVLPKGAHAMVLYGDPGKAGAYVMRLKVPAGYKVLPHHHSQIENVTVISGTMMIGMGDKFEQKEMQVLKQGEFMSIPAMNNHYAMGKTAAEIQIHGEGPFDITYVNPDDDPSKAKK